MIFIICKIKTYTELWDYTYIIYFYFYTILYIYTVRTPVTKPSRDDIAVIMYTSGSTGKPKGNFFITNLLHIYYTLFTYSNYLLITIALVQDFL